jgi:hypothetical protein
MRSLISCLAPRPNSEKRSSFFNIAFFTHGVSLLGIIALDHDLWQRRGYRRAAVPPQPIAELAPRKAIGLTGGSKT